MQFPVVLVLFAGAIALLAGSSHFTIRAVEELVQMTRLSEASAGVVILALLTSTPEITIAGFAILQGSPGLSIGDILGSNVFNIGVVLGLLGAMGLLHMCCTDNLVELTDIVFLIALIPILLLIFTSLSPVIGGVLLALFVVSTWMSKSSRMLCCASPTKRWKSSVM